jgi:predicted  nucleic acid-binding Zn-ribbon protein
LQNEAAALGRYLNKLEEIQLEKMIAFEDSQAHTEEKNEILEKAKSKKIQDTALLKGERSKLVEQSEKLDSNKLTVLEDVEPDNLRMYNKLRDKKRGRAVAEVKNDICSACGSTLTAAQAQEARSPITITCCNSCGRVLYSV